MSFTVSADGAANRRDEELLEGLVLARADDELGAKVGKILNLSRLLGDLLTVVWSVIIKLLSFISENNLVLLYK